MRYSIPAHRFANAKAFMATASLALVFSGCQKPPQSEPTAEHGNGQATQNTAEVSLQLGTEEDYHRILKSHEGKVVLVDFWATWCLPCMVQFPHTVELVNNHRDAGFTAISVSMDEPDSQESVLEFLQNQSANFDNLLTSYGASGQFADAFEIQGDVPFYKLYDRQGKLRYTFSGNPEGVENCEPVEKMDERVAELLSEPQ